MFNFLKKHKPNTAGNDQPVDINAFRREARAHQKQVSDEKLKRMGDMASKEGVVRPDQAHEAQDQAHVVTGEHPVLDTSQPGGAPKTDAS